MRLSRKKKVLLIAVVVLSALVALHIKVKQAVHITMAAEEIDISTMMGQYVTILCDPYLDDDRYPIIDKYEIIAVENENGVFQPLLYGGKLTTGGSSMVYVSPNNFIGDAIKSYNYGLRNRFVFRGVLSAGPRVGDYNLKLDSWDIVYPILHCEFLDGPEEEFYTRNIFVFDYLIPF